MEKIWKRAFFTLMFIFLACLGFVVYLALKPIDFTPSTSQDLEYQESKDLDFDLILDSDDLEELFKSAMENRNLPGYLKIDSDFFFLFPIEFMGQKVELSLRGDPKVTQEGNIEILVSQVNIGQLDISKKLALNLLSYNLVEDGPLKIGRESESLYLDFMVIGREKNIKIKAKSIDLEKENLVFTIEIEKDKILNQKETWNGD